MSTKRRTQERGWRRGWDDGTHPSGVNTHLSHSAPSTWETLDNVYRDAYERGWAAAREDPAQPRTEDDEPTRWEGATVYTYGRSATVERLTEGRPGYVDLVWPHGSRTSVPIEEVLGWVWSDGDAHDELAALAVPRGLPGVSAHIEVDDEGITFHVSPTRRARLRAAPGGGVAVFYDEPSTTTWPDARKRRTYHNAMEALAAVADWLEPF